jgi:hypothetical protein
MRARFRTTLMVVLAMGAGPTLIAAQESRSAEPARALTALLDARGAGAIAAADPDAPGRFIAALYFPGDQLLVVSSRYAVPQLMDRRLAQGQYREAYADLQGAPPEGRVFVQDLRADGLWPTCGPGEAYDIVYQDGDTYATFNGDCAGQHLAEHEYQARFATADERYARMLAVLVKAVRSGT